MYTWFLWVYKVSVAVGMAGYVLFLLELMGIGALLRPVVPQSLAVMLIWYGLYFGILGRDCAEVAADRMVSPILPTVLIASRKQLEYSIQHEGLLHFHHTPWTVFVDLFRRR